MIPIFSLRVNPHGHRSRLPATAQDDQGKDDAPVESKEEGKAGDG